jgi:ubiquinone/menaquinone biosynthesis C-methylase UbiE
MLLLILSGCAQLAYESMNDPSRDAWQQPEDVVQALDIANGARVADLGAGGGYFTFPLADAVGPEGRVYAVDVEEASLRFIDKRARELGFRNIALILAMPDDALLPADGVDLIFTSNTYHHLTDRVAYFKSLMRHLRSAGRVAIIEYKDTGWFGHATPKETVRREMETAGYRLVKDFDFLPKQHFQIFKPVVP